MIRRPPRPPLFPSPPLFRSPALTRRTAAAAATTTAPATILRAFLGLVDAQRPAEERPQNGGGGRSEEHTSELQSLTNLVCRLLLGKKKHTAPATHNTVYHIS